jgi:hypothetical protein
MLAFMFVLAAALLVAAFYVFIFFVRCDTDLASGGV